MSIIGGTKVSDMGIGTWGMGGKQSPDDGNHRESLEAIQYLVSRGVNIIDTAEMYAAGHTEEIVGEAIQGMDRKKLFLITKVWNNHLDRLSVPKSLDASLKRLKQDYVDLFLIHWPNPEVPIRETISAMEDLVNEGKTRMIGVSNFSVDQLKEAMETSSDHPIAANQIEYNFGRRDQEADIIPFCHSNNVSVIAYTPIMRGKINSKIIRKMAEKYSATPVQIALSYVMKKSIPIPKSINRAHIDELLGAMDIKLSDDDYRVLAES